MTGALHAPFAILFVGLLDSLLIAAVATMRPRSEGRFLARVCTATLLLRASLAIVLNYFAADSTFAATLWGDSGTYDGGGDLLARKWAGESGGATQLTHALSGWGFVYAVGALYFVFGRNQLLVQLLNCTIGTLTVLAVYGIAARLFGRSVGRKAALLMAFFPQVIFWSAGMYKDPLILFCIAICMYAVVRLREGFSTAMVALFVGGAFALLSLRFYIFYFVVAAALGTFVFGGRGGVVQRLASFVVLSAVLVGAFTLGVREETLERQAAFMTLDQVQVTRTDQAMWGQSAYGEGHDVTTFGGALRALPVGLAYLLFAPFPWAITGVRQALTLPETLVWYGLMPAFGMGLAYAIRHRFREILPILVFTVTLTLAYALMQWNVGTAYRQRTQISMFFFVFMGVGLQLRQAHRAKGTEMEAQEAGDAVSIALGHGPVADHDFLAPEGTGDAVTGGSPGADGGRTTTAASQQLPHRRPLEPGR